MSDHYIIGRNKQKCQEVLLSFSSSVIPIVLPQSILKLSGFHCTLYRDSAGYLIIDGWGRYKSTNGIYVNGKKVESMFLKNNDVVYLGCQEIILKYHNDEQEENEIPEYQKTFTAKIS
ncbi:MAG: FHA domain-containing protein [Aetokthonos hydrillicola CCALA 1050]|nr:FHA domain-containing protein [Aetokthonos hydrillicola CCALA 1050]